MAPSELQSRSTVHWELEGIARCNTRNIRRSIFRCLSFILPRSRSSSFDFGMMNSTSAMLRRCASSAISANQISRSAMSFC